jgi:hypothetical protein
MDKRQWSEGLPRWRCHRCRRRRGRTLVCHEGWEERPRRQRRLRPPDFGSGPCPDPVVGRLRGYGTTSNRQAKPGCDQHRQATGKLCQVRPRHDVLPEARKPMVGMRRAKTYSRASGRERPMRARRVPICLRTLSCSSLRRKEVSLGPVEGLGHDRLPPIGARSDIVGASARMMRRDAPPTERRTA